MTAEMSLALVEGLSAVARVEGCVMKGRGRLGLLVWARDDAADVDGLGWAEGWNGIEGARTRGGV